MVDWPFDKPTFGLTPASFCTKTLRHMHLSPEAGVDSPHGATRKTIDTNLSVLLLLVFQLERFGASTSEDGRCLDFRMGVPKFFPDLHTRRHNHLHRCLTTEFDGVFSTLYEKRRLRMIKRVLLGSLRLSKDKRSFRHIERNH